ncbi:MAG TPA: prepilin-type N-terminal cleavage/methylation domain-containing protein [Pyrinomonadaceae bacterium]|nr:prepilin-type N-terminal cleavage/methylation domain-containing protein [Pyrinomonadaceae bacterium]
MKKQVTKKQVVGQQGFTLIETAVSMVVMMIVGLGAASLFVFALGTNNSARDRELSMAVAQQQMERLRSAKFADLATTLTATGGANKIVASGDRSYSVVTTIADTVAGNATQKTITVQVTPVTANTNGLTAIQRVFGGVTLVTRRSTVLLGPNRG